MLPHQSTFIPIKAESMQGTCLLEPGRSEVVQVERSCITLQADGRHRRY